MANNKEIRSPLIQKMGNKKAYAACLKTETASAEERSLTAAPSTDKLYGADVTQTNGIA